jgi:predicted nucleic acid-binding protein
VILVDASVWVDYFRVGDEELASILEAGEVLTHRFVVGELALGNLPNRERYLLYLNRLPRTAEATHEEVLDVVQRHRLFGMGIGYVDAHLLAALGLTPHTILWTRDRRMTSAADRLGLATRRPYRA